MQYANKPKWILENIINFKVITTIYIIVKEIQQQHKHATTNNEIKMLFFFSIFATSILFMVIKADLD